MWENIIIEIRAWVWWDEASIFAKELSKAYLSYAKNKWFNIEINDQLYTESWWIKQIILYINWKWVYNLFKNESWIHRVQRVPTNENKWKMQTSTISVVVLEKKEKLNIILKQEDLEIKTTKSSWAWWQHVNKTDSAVHIKHLPTWISVFCQESRSQHKNKEIALEILLNKIKNVEENKLIKKVWDERSIQIWNSERSEKIKTYNFPNDKLIDHRNGKTYSWLSRILKWNLEKILE